MMTARAKAVRARSSVRRATPEDAAIGAKVRSRRIEKELSQTDLANKIGVTFQQVQKYEKGVNRIGGGRLQRLCAALDVPSSFFLGGSDTDEASSVMLTLAQDRGAVRILQAYNSMPRAKRTALVEVAEQLA